MDRETKQGLLQRIVRYSRLFALLPLCSVSDRFFVVLLLELVVLTIGASSSHCSIATSFAPVPVRTKTLFRFIFSGGSFQHRALGDQRSFFFVSTLTLPVFFRFDCLNRFLLIYIFKRKKQLKKRLFRGSI